MIPPYHDRLIRISLILFAIFSPVSIAGTHISISLAVLLWIVVMLSKKRFSFRNTALNLPLLGLAAAALISTVFSVDVKFSLKGLKSASLIIVYFVVVNNLKSKSQVKTLINTLIAFTSVSAAYGIFQHFTGIDFLGYNDSLNKLLPRATGFYDIPMTFSEYISMISMIILSLLLFFRKKNAPFILALILVISGLYFSFTRGAWMGTLSGFLLLLFLRNKKLFFAGLITAAAIGSAALLLFPGSTISRRIYTLTERKDNPVIKRMFIWECSLNMVRDFPLTGVGWECFRKAYPRYTNYSGPYRGWKWRQFITKTYTHAHNNFLNIAAETGIIGMGAFLWIIIVIFAEFLVSYRNLTDDYLKSLHGGIFASLVVFLVTGLTEYTFGDSEVAMLFYFLAGIFFIIPVLDKKKEDLP